MAHLVYDNFKKLLLSGTIDLVNDPIYGMLLSGSYTPNTGHAVVGDVSAYQVTDPLAGYTPGGQLLSSKTLTIANNYSIFDAADLSWSNTTINQASGIVLWYSGATPATRYLICWNSMGIVSTTNGTLQITWNNTDGIMKIGDA